MPASGKSTVSIVLAECIKNNLKRFVALISGDNFANICYGCTYSEDEMNMKYQNLKSVLMNLLEVDGYIIIDDFFKREKDYIDIRNFLNNAGRHVFVAKINCDFNERLIRDSFRNSGKKLGIDLMNEYEHNYKSVLDTLPFDLCVNTGTETIDEIVKKIEGFLEE